MSHSNNLLSEDKPKNTGSVLGALKKYKDLYFRFVGNNVYDDTILLNYICSCEKNNCNCTIIISNDKFSDIELRHKNNIYTFLFVDDGKFIVPLLQ